MKFLFAIMGLDYSGAPKMMSWVANQMVEKGHEVHLVTYFSNNRSSALDERVVMHSLQVVRSGSRLVRNTTGMFTTIAKLHKLVKELNPDIFVSFLDSVGYVYLPIGRVLTKSKLVVSERVDPYSYQGFVTKIRFALMKFAHGTVFQTKGAQDFYSKYKKIYRNSTVIPNPVVVSPSVLSIQNHIPSADERDKVIVTVGRLSIKQKRQDVLLKAYKIFRESHPEYKLIVYGDGPDKGTINALINEMGLSDCVTLAGRTDHVEEDIFRAGVFVLTSDFEGIPNALIEAMSIGVPSVSTDCSPGGAALLIQDGENGFLVPRKNAEALAEKMSLIVSDTDISERLSKTGPSITNEFSEIVISDKWETFFESINNKR